MSKTLSHLYTYQQVSCLKVLIVNALRELNHALMIVNCGRRLGQGLGFLARDNFYCGESSQMPALNVSHFCRYNWESVCFI